MDHTLEQLLRRLFELSQAYDALVARVAELEAQIQEAADATC